ncbi:MAG: cell division ATP-binding protein FtsE [Bacteroidales bacterium]
MIGKSVISFTECSLHRQEQLVLDIDDLEIYKSEFVYLVGAVGAGKSTLIKSICAEILPQKGKLKVAEFDLSTIKPKEIPYLRRRLGIVFQDYKLLTDRNVEKNLDFVLKSTGWTDKNKITQRIMEVLHTVEMEKMRTRMPHELSGGEQQRICIARAILNEPEIILADEPTAQLDPQNAENIIKLLERLNSTGKTVVVATHAHALVEKFPHKTYILKNKSIKLEENFSTEGDYMGLLN